MTGPEHYRQAEDLLTDAGIMDRGSPTEKGMIAETAGERGPA